MRLASLLLVTFLSFFSFNAFAEVVNLNKADAAAMSYYLKGIGEKKAKNIVKYRKENGAFKQVDDVMNVKGIGEGIFKKIKADLSLTSGKTTAPEKKTKAKKQEEPKKLVKDKADKKAKTKEEKK
jgi:competence protein ComEA